MLFNLLSKIGKTCCVYRKTRKFYGNQFDKNKSSAEQKILEDESGMQSTVASADITDVVDSLSNRSGSSASAKKINI